MNLFASKDKENKGMWAFFLTFCDPTYDEVAHLLEDLSPVQSWTLLAEEKPNQCEESSILVFVFFSLAVTVTWVLQGVSRCHVWFFSLVSDRTIVQTIRTFWPLCLSSVCAFRFHILGWHEHALVWHCLFQWRPNRLFSGCGCSRVLPCLAVRFVGWQFLIDFFGYPNGSIYSFPRHHLCKVCIYQRVTTCGPSDIFGKIHSSYASEITVGNTDLVMRAEKLGWCTRYHHKTRTCPDRWTEQNLSALPLLKCHNTGSVTTEGNFFPVIRGPSFPQRIDVFCSLRPITHLCRPE